MRLRQKRVQLEARQTRSRIHSRSPTSHSIAQSPLAVASRNRSPFGEPVRGGSGGANLGTGFRWRGAARSTASSKDEQASCGVESSPQSVGTGYQNSATLQLGMIIGEPGNSQSVKDSDAVSTTSSMPTSASVHNQNLIESAGAPRPVDPLANSLQSVGSNYGSKKQLSQMSGSTGSAQPRPVLKVSTVRQGDPSSIQTQPRTPQARVGTFTPMSRTGPSSGHVSPLVRATGGRPSVTSPQVARSPQSLRAPKMASTSAPVGAVTVGAVGVAKAQQSTGTVRTMAPARGFPLKGRESFQLSETGKTTV